MSADDARPTHEEQATPAVIVVGDDSSAASDAALDLALRLAAADGARVVAVAGGGTLRVRPAGLAAAGVERVSHPDPPVDALRAVAEREGADLIVVGATHRGKLGRLAPGGLAERLMHEGAPCAVAVAPAGARHGPIRTVAVAYDGRPESVAALDAGIRLAGAHGATLRVLAVYESPWASVDLPLVEIQDPDRDRMVADVERLVAELPPTLLASGKVLTGRAGHALTSACADDVELLVTGSRSYGPLHGAVVGSVSRHLADHAPCPVLVVPRGAAHSRSSLATAVTSPR